MDKERLEEITREIFEIFEIYAPPIPIETMLGQPPAGLWEEVDIAQLSGSFLSVKERYSPRMSLARLLARHIAQSEWGAQRNLHTMINSEDAVHTFARMLLIPADMIDGLTSNTRNPRVISQQFEAPEEEVRQRLLELL